MRIRLMVLAVLTLFLGPFLLAGCAVVANRLYVPPERENARVNAAETELAAAEATRLSLVSWNIGYAGMGAEADFVMDGGSQMRPL